MDNSTLNIANMLKNEMAKNRIVRQDVSDAILFLQDNANEELAGNIYTKSIVFYGSVTTKKIYVPNFILLSAMQEFADKLDSAYETMEQNFMQL